MWAAEAVSFVYHSCFRIYTCFIVFLTFTVYLGANGQSSEPIPIEQNAQSSRTLDFIICSKVIVNQSHTSNENIFLWANQLTIEIGDKCPLILKTQWQNRGEQKCDKFAKVG